MADSLFDIDAEPAVVRSAAILSDCGRYRYALERTWLDARPPVCFVMLNPSTADAEKDDPTIRRCTAFARRWGHGGMVVVNLFALRSTDPTALGRDHAPIGPANDEAIREAARGRRVVAAWGCHGTLGGRDKAVLQILSGQSVQCLGTTKDGHPRHPLYLPACAKPVPYPVNGGAA